MKGIKLGKKKLMAMHIAITIIANGLTIALITIPGCSRPANKYRSLDLARLPEEAKVSIWKELYPNGLDCSQQSCEEFFKNVK